MNGPRSVYIVLIEQDAEYTGSDSWWKKGEFLAASPEKAIEEAYANTYLTASRGRAARRTDQVAVVGPDCPWIEFTVELESHPASYVSRRREP